jgi:hypothetical protein
VEYWLDNNHSGGEQKTGTVDYFILGFKFDGGCTLKHLNRDIIQYIVAMYAGFVVSLVPSYEMLESQLKPDIKLDYEVEAISSANSACRVDLIKSIKADYWCSATNTIPGWLEFDFGKHVAFQWIAFAISNNSNIHPKQVTVSTPRNLERKQDWLKRYELYTFERTNSELGMNWNIIGWQIFRAPIERTRYLRFDFDECWGTTGGPYYEFVGVAFFEGASFINSEDKLSTYRSTHNADFLAERDVHPSFL